ncbi:MAG: ABC transporter [Chloroflexi bacterium HGW-Chloroflexi-1]|nr:MAG: ABC transporter [Chloroflexi bacterium HGW-Chloroflexi-1]
MTDNVIRTERLTKSYGKSRGVVDLDITVNCGEIYGYLGPNGAGKTTTIRTLLDFIRPTRGRVTVFGLDAHADSLAIRRRVGYLPGELSLYKDMTGHGFLRYMAGLRGGVEWKYVETLAGHLACNLAQPIRTLSHGNKQKLGLVQAFMHKPELLILDEPTQGLDPLVQQRFYHLLAEARAAGRTVFLSSHVLPEVAKTCDRVGIIREGRLVAVEQVAALKAKALRRLEIRFAAAVPPAVFAGLPGVRDVRVENGALHCTVVGPLDLVVKTAAQFEVVDLVSHEPSLEEVFLAHYSSEEAGGRT